MKKKRKIIYVLICYIVNLNMGRCINGAVYGAHFFIIAQGININSIEDDITDLDHSLGRCLIMYADINRVMHPV